MPYLAEENESEEKERPGPSRRLPRAMEYKAKYIEK